MNEFDLRKASDKLDSLGIYNPSRDEIKDMVKGSSVSPQLNSIVLDCLVDGIILDNLIQEGLIDEKTKKVGAFKQPLIENYLSGLSNNIKRDSEKRAEFTATCEESFFKESAHSK